jgi:redox-sensitive bicupin YhaK (pirin superfamily)
MKTAQKLNDERANQVTFGANAAPGTKQVLSIHRRGAGHWVGDGFPVHTLFNYRDLGREVTPFLLLDHAGPAQFAPATAPRGVDWHPHRGFETVTISFQGEVDHEDTAGNRGTIRPGDVQWMTAGSGVLHKEMHSRAFTKQGGTFEMLQLWVNLPAKLKMVEPRYQALLAEDIANVRLPEDAGSVRVIAGEFAGSKGPAQTFTPVSLFEIRLRAGKSVSVDLQNGHTGALLVMKGEIAVNDGEQAHETELVILGREGNGLRLKAIADATIFVMSGEPIDEPIVGHGPFVMNSSQEIAKAIGDLHAGKFGTTPE